MHYIMVLIGIVCVIGGFALTELYKKSGLNIIGSFIMLGGLILTFFELLNAFVPNFFNS
ncbi:MAG: hypothetical protein HY934_01755 [Candidatus Firestonebacteria bacterium]|nr:hypothetical protein [Candidatus Firestonebacteria bacterium]